jgi:hypothetical protein
VYNSPDMFGSGILPDADEPPFKGLWPDSVENRLRELSVGSQAFAFLLEGATRTYGLTWHVDGKRKRLFLHHHMKVVFDEGKPLDGETAALGSIDLRITV